MSLLLSGSQNDLDEVTEVAALGGAGLEAENPFATEPSYFGACEEFPAAACQKCPTLFCSEGSPELKER